MSERVRGVGGRHRLVGVVRAPEDVDGLEPLIERRRVAGLRTDGPQIQGWQDFGSTPSTARENGRARRRITASLKTVEEGAALSGHHAKGIPPHALLKLQRVLAAITPWDDHQGFARAGGPSWRAKVLDPPAPWLILFVLRDVVGCSDLGRHEKLSFEVPLRLDDRRMTVTLEKFGVRVYVGRDCARDEDAVQQAADALMERIRRAVPLLEKHVLRPIAEERLRHGHVTIDNRFQHHLDMYECFRARAKSLATEAETATEPPPDRGEGLMGPFLSFRSLRWELRRNAGFDAAAAVAAFFSLLEHLLVFQLAFDFDSKVDDLEKSVGDDWAAKFRRVLDITNTEAKQHYDALREVAQQVRNPAMHGGFDRRQSRFHFHLEGVGAVPAQLSQARDGTDYWFLDDPHPAEGAEVWDVINAFFRWAMFGPLGYAWALAVGGFDVAFDEQSRARLVEAAQTPEQFHAYLESRAHWETNAVNMDW